ncbi:MAG: tolR [Alphaproteobacteria bacterium]|jgi:biopolymer transport protein TolR|nr:tolR [Alphaproteobacteria bacterium]
MAVSLNRLSGRSGSRRRSTGQTFTDINVTPFVDVMLVLLVIFMVTAPMLTVGVPVDLPKTKAAKMNDQTEPLVVSVDAQGKSYLQEVELDGDALIERLIAVSGNNPDAKIYVRGDQKIHYGRVMEIMGVIAAAGFSKVSLIAEMPSGVDKGRSLTVRKSVPNLATPAPLPPTGQGAPRPLPNPPQGGFRAPPFTPPQGRQPTPLSRPGVKPGVAPPMPVVQKMNSVTNPASGPKVIRSQ